MKNLLQSLLLIIAMLVSTTETEEHIYVRVGDTVTLRPPPRASTRKQYVTWSFGGKDIAGYNTFKSWVDTDKKWENASMPGDVWLQIKSVSLGHFGTFVCRLTYGGDQAIIDSVSYTLVKVDVSKIPTSPLLPGDSFSLVCETKSPQGDSTPEMRWLDPQREAHAAKITMTATSQHNGEWTCVVASDKTPTQHKVLVTVVDLSPPVSRSEYTSKSALLSIPCSTSSQVSWGQVKAVGIQGGHWEFFPQLDSGLISPDPQRLFSLSLEDPVDWKAEQDAGLIPTSDLKKGNLSLKRTQGREEDRGKYVCSLKFRNGVTLKRTVNVHVLQITSVQGTDLISGQSLNLTCGLGFTLPPHLHLKWIPPAESSVQPTGSSLHITVDVGDSGKWKCELWEGDSKKTSAVITLKIEHRYSVWMLVIICSATVIGFLLLLLVFILWRRRQQRIRHPRHRLCKCKNPKPKGFYRT